MTVHLLHMDDATLAFFSSSSDEVQEDDGVKYCRGFLVEGADLSGITFKNVEFVSGDFLTCNLSGTTFEGCCLTGVGFENCNLTDSNWYDVNATQISFKKCEGDYCGRSKNRAQR